MRETLIIIGAGGHGKVLADIAASMNQWKQIAFLDDHSYASSCLGFPILGTSERIAEFTDQADFILGIGNNARRKDMQEQLARSGCSIATMTHPAATIGREVMLGEGTVVMAGAVINCSTRIGRGCIINTSSSIDHDNDIGDYVHISPGAHLAGSVTVGELSWIGIGASVINNISITSDSIVGAGAVVVQNVTEQGTYVGVPARRIK